MPLLRRLAFLGIGFKSIRKSIKNAETNIFQQNKDFVEFALKAGGDEVKVKELSVLLTKALRFRKRKAIIKKVASSLMFWPFLLLVLGLPVLQASYTSQHYTDLKGWGFTGITVLLFLLGVVFTVIIGTIANFITKLEVKIGRSFRMIIRFALLVLPHLYVYYSYNTPDTWWRLIAVWSCLMVCIVFDMVLVMQLFIDTFPDVYFYSQKIHLTDELMLESVYGLAKEKDWNTLMRKRNRRNVMIGEVERLASLIEFDWNSHVTVKDSKNEKWKNTTTRGIANGIRRLKRELILPGPRSEEILKTRFNELFVCIINHNLQGFIQENVPAHRIKKTSPLKIVQQFLVALLPMLLGVGLCKYFSGIVPPEYQGVVLLVGIAWFIVCVLLWLDPNLADKMMVVKRGRNLMNPLSDNND